MLYLSFKFVRKFKFCVSPLVKRYPGIPYNEVNVKPDTWRLKQNKRQTCIGCV